MPRFQHNKLLGAFRVHREHRRDDLVTGWRSLTHPEVPLRIQPNSDVIGPYVCNYPRSALGDVDVVVNRRALIVGLLNIPMPVLDLCRDTRCERAAQTPCASEP